MSTAKPFFSVAIPTYNRAQLLKLAIESVLRQTFEDFEIVISNSASTDNTREVIESFNDSRIRHIESKEKMVVGDNYQTALDNTCGEYITFLSDDDAYSPILLEHAKKIIDEQNAEIVGYQYCRYYYDDLFDFERPISKNTLLIENFSGKVTKFSSKEAVEQVYLNYGLSRVEQNSDFIMPYLSNAVYHNELFKKLKLVSPSLFHTVPPDMYLAIAVFFVSNYYYCLDEPLLVWSNWKGNATASAQRENTSLRQHYEKLLNGKELVHTPLKFPFALNCGINSILQAKEDFSANEVEIDWSMYFKSTYENLTYLNRVGIDTSQEEEEFNNILSTQSIDVQEKVQKDLSDYSFITKTYLNKHLPTFARFLRNVFNVISKNKLTLIQGEDKTFHNASEAAQIIDQDLLFRLLKIN